MNNLIIDINGLNKYFAAEHIVKNLTVQVAQGEIFGFLGPNGSGKTTAIRMMCGLLSPSSGQGRCMGLDIIKDKEKIKKSVGYMTQYFSLWGALSVRQNLTFVARMYQLQHPDARVEEVMAQFALTERQHQLARTLSGGWKQRLSLAACLIHSPKVIFLDEPTAGVDPAARQVFWRELYRVAAQGVTILVSTHYMDEAERCNNLAYIAKGRVLIQGKPNDIINSQKLYSWEIAGRDLPALEKRLLANTEIAHVCQRGNLLYITARQELPLAEMIEKFQPGYQICRCPLSLEDIFSCLSKGSALIEAC